MNKYASDPNEQEILPNLLNLKTEQEIAQAELNGFIYAEAVLYDELTTSTVFNTGYICKIHTLIFGHLYSFAGKYRQVNISKAGFSFPPARFLEASMAEFDKDIFNKLPRIYNSKEELIINVAKVHGELLFIHPFREGNGRASRLLANLMVQQQGYDDLKFEKINDGLFETYIEAVQKCGLKKYELMQEVISTLL
ncbi:cell filamentation protein Fic [Flavobacterium akiainvivens]|uniref:protein adenylyltransferase n=1 Tax=Flavobacterium akiainvivens TaxID=1202724 RepID=A0A0M8MM50_9FLAO|nr:Fic family protein [Flavobacterium akiainvivens]KOS08368.1 cell filamentation protein Fic [Flavobacterium akiainvivens]SFQ72827.1 cell filamentation protein [Flavobacterium akiainvivens]